MNRRYENRDLKVGDQVMYQDEVETIHSISRDEYGEYDVQIDAITISFVNHPNLR